MTTEIRFVSAHRPDPTLGEGVYTITVRQDLSVRGARSSTRSVAKRFEIAGEHRALAPADVVAVFPPEGSLGDHGATLPHILLSRSTLPWEQNGAADGTDLDLPWLALLLLDEDDTVETSVKSLAELRAMAEFGTTPPVPGQRDDDRVAVLGIVPDRLAELLPTGAELSLLAHVRERGEAGQPATEDLAAVVGNRLPRGGRTSTAHLVSVAARYRKGRFDAGPATGGLVHLVSLKSWRFASIPAGPAFDALVGALDRTPSTVSLPPIGKKSADPFLARGYVAVPHRLRQAEQTVSWYHGPLGPQHSAGTADGLLPVRASDALLRLDAATGMLDVSYAAAWQLGRLLALRSRRFSTGYGDWRRAQRRAHRLAGPVRAAPLPLPGAQDVVDPEVPAVVRDWIADLSHLVDVPFNYLVPDARMLPAESFRAFRLDTLWIRCLLDGALSLGRVTRGDEAFEAAHLAGLSAPPTRAVSGFLLRSALVAGWPTMRTDAYDVAPPAAGDLAGLVAMTPLRSERLSESVLLCLFAGDVKAFHLHLPPETLHLGVDRDPTSPTGFVKNLRGPAAPTTARSAPVTWRTIVRGDSTQTVDQVVDVASLAAGIGSPLNAAQFARWMIEGAPSLLLRIMVSEPLT